MAEELVKLYGIASRGVNISENPLALGLDELVSAQNAEVVSDGGELALDQRPGMTRVNRTALDRILVAQDVPADLLLTKVPTLYAGMYAGSTHNWRKSTDGATWTDADAPVKPVSNNTNMGFFKRLTKCVTIGKKLFFVDGATPIAVHSWDGTTDAVVGYVPPAVAGVTLATPPDPTAAYEFDTAGATTYSYKLVAIAGASNSAATNAVAVAGRATLDSSNFNAITPVNPPVAGALSYDVYRTVGGATQGKIGTIPIVAGAFTTGNGSNKTGTVWGSVGSPATAQFGSHNGVTYQYRAVQTNGSAHSAAGAVSTVSDGPTSLNSLNYFNISLAGIGSGVFDIYRVTGGATQGKIGSYDAGLVSGLQDTGLAGDGTTAPSTASGLAPSGAYVFTDAALAGDGGSAPSSATGASSADAIGVLDLTTDGSNLYLAVLDNASSDPTVYGRILQLAVLSGAWLQIGANFPTATGNGAPGALAFYDGASVYGTYIGTTSGNASYLAGTGNPLPAGGFPEAHATSSSQAACSLAVFNGILYAGYVSLVAGTAAILVKRTPIATWATSLTAGGVIQYNAFTSLAVFNGRLYAGWTSSGGVSPIISSTADGTTWVTELTLGVGEIVGQMVTFGSALYVVTGKTGAVHNTVSRIIKRDTAGSWTTADDPSDDFAGCLGVLYV